MTRSTFRLAIRAPYNYKVLHVVTLPRMFSPVRFVASVGHWTRFLLAEVGAYSLLLAGTVLSLRSVGRDRRLILQQMEHIGTNSLPLVLIVGIFTGAVSAWQAAPVKIPTMS